MESKLAPRSILLLMIAVSCSLFGQTVVWQRTSGPYKATVRALATTPAGELFAGTDGGLYRSSDSGATWRLESLDRFLWSHQEPQVNAILASSAGVLIVGQGYGGILRSTDNGASWTTSDFPYEGDVRSLASTSSHAFYAGTYRDGIYKSTDLGLSWHKTSISSSSVFSLFVDPEDRIYAGADGAIIRSTDGGISWEYTSIEAATFRSIQMSPGGLLFAGAWDGGLFISTDKGASWSTRNQNLPRLDIDALAFDSTGNFYAGILVTGLYQSTDDGQSWTRVGFTNESVLSLLVTRSNTLITGSFLGIHFSTDAAGTLEEKNTGLMNTYPTMLASTTTGSMFTTLNGRGLYRSLDGGLGWTRLSTENVGGITADARGNVYVGTYTGIWKSSDNGNDWTTLQVPFFPYMITVDDNVIYAGTWDGEVFRSGDGGANWKRLRSDGDYGTIRAIRLNHQRHVFVTILYKGVFRSTNEGRDWQEISAMLPTKYVYDLLVDPLERLFLATDRGVFRSTDNGSSWELPSTDLRFTAAWCLAMDSNQQLFAGTVDGVYSSNDLGKSWKMISPDGPRGLVFDVLVSPTGYLCAGTNGQGLYRSISPTAVQPVQQSLSQNFPNPFNSSTTILFELSAPSDVKLSVFNTIGQKIETLIDWRLAAGRYSIDWRPRAVSSGVYFYRLITASHVDTRKIVFLK
jgi:photosystem II stability/assembly factor-like uncharacterized protein